MTAAPPIERDSPWRPLVPVAVALPLALAILVAVVVLSRQAESGTNAPAVPEFQPPARSELPRFSVRSVNGGTAVLVPDSQQGQSVDVTRDVPLDQAGIEVLRRVAPRGVEAGDKVTVVGVYNEVRNFSIRYTLVHTGEAATDGDGVPRSALGFAGYEASPDPIERPVAAGAVIEAAADGQLVVEGPGGPMSITFTAEPVIYEIQPGGPQDVRPGDRVALLERDGEPPALLVLPGN